MQIYNCMTINQQSFNKKHPTHIASDAKNSIRLFCFVLSYFPNLCWRAVGDILRFVRLCAAHGGNNKHNKHNYAQKNYFIRRFDGHFNIFIKTARGMSLNFCGQFFIFIQYKHPKQINYLRARYFRISIAHATRMITPLII